MTGGVRTLAARGTTQDLDAEGKEEAAVRRQQLSYRATSAAVPPNCRWRAACWLLLLLVFCCGSSSLFFFPGPGWRLPL